MLHNRVQLKVPFYRHQLDPSDATRVAEVLASPILTSGQVGRDVERQLAEYFCVPHALVVNSWTNGALACLMALDIGPGDEVIVPAMTFIASANVVELVGAKPVFVDVNPDTLMLDCEQVSAALTHRTRAVIPVHLYGQMVDVEALRRCVGESIKIIEDCAHCFEGTLNGARPGAFSDAAIFSFYATKNLTCGEGGAIITRDADLAEKLRMTRLHGMSAGAIDRYRSGAYQHWDMLRLGAKANLPDLLSALLPRQIAQVHEKRAQRTTLARRYEEAFSENRFVHLQARVPGAVHAWHLFAIWVPPAMRDRLILALNEAGIGCAVNFRSVPCMTYYQQRYDYRPGSFPVSERWGQGTISLPLYPGLSDEDQSYVIAAVQRELCRLSQHPLANTLSE